MKRIDLIRHLERHGAQFLREGGNHSVYGIAKVEKSQQFRVIVRLTNFFPKKFVETYRYPSHKKGDGCVDNWGPG